MDTDWKVIKAETAKIGRFEVILETVMFAPETVGPYSYIKYKSDGVCMLPVTPDGKIALVRQYRRAIGQVSLEVPAGMIDENETPDEAAVRELKEETGLTAYKWISCGTVHSSPGSSSEKLHLFIALCHENDRTAQALDPSEKISIEWHSIQSVKALMEKNLLTHCASQLLFYHYMGSFGLVGQDQT